MSLFANNPELRACFESDAVRLIYQLQENLAALTSGPAGPEPLATFHALTHTLRGAAALVEIPDLAEVCGDFMRLGEVAGSFQHSAQAQAAEIFEFVQGSLDAVLQSVIHSLANEDEAAAVLCQTIHAAVQERWKDYFYDSNVTEAEGGFAAFHAVPVSADGENAQVSDFLSEVESETPAPEICAATVSENLGATDDFLSAVGDHAEAPAPALADGASDFLSSMDEVSAAPEPMAVPEHSRLVHATGGSATDDFLSAMGEPAATPAARREENSDDFLAAMDAPASSAAEAEAVADFMGGLDDAPAWPTADERATAPAPNASFETELLGYFYEDALTNLNALQISLRRWRQHPEDTAALQALHRQTHTIKGAARTTGLVDLGHLANAVEDVIEDHLEQRPACAPAALAALLARMSENMHAAIRDLRATAMLAGSLNDITGTILHAESLRRRAPMETIVPASSTSASAPAAAGFETDLLPFFYEDALTNLDSLEQSLHQWEENPDDAESLQAVYRHTHTIKGAANSTGLADIGRMVHAVEDVLEECVEKKLTLAPAALASLVYEMADGIKAGIAELQAQGAFTGSLKTFAALIEKTAALRSAPPVKPAARRRKRRAEKIETSIETTAAVPEASSPAPVSEEVAATPVVPVSEIVPVEEEAVELTPVLATSASAPGATPAENTEAQTIRVSSQRLDAVMNLIGELIISRTRLDKKITDIARLKDELNFCKSRLLEAISGFHERFEYSRRNHRGGRRGGSDLAALGLAAPGAEGFSELEFDRYDEFNIMARSLVETGNDISEVISQLDRFFGSFNEESGQFNKTTTNLQNEVTRIRMVSLTFLFRRLQRSVRDAAQREGKEVEFRLEGGETQLDKNIVDEVYSPLLHLVRNSVSHGIESGELRRQSGKAAHGTVSVRAFQEANQVVIEIADDGGGLNFAAIRATALERGLITADAQPTEEELTSLIFRAGFSTAKTVSQISGRGVGMDVVGSVVSRLNGSIEVRSVAGRGCTFIVRLPLTLAINQAMMITVSGSKFALPLSFVEHIVPFRPEGRILSGDRELWRTNQASLPLVRLDRMFGLPPAETKHANVVLVRVANKSLALLVDEQLTRQDIVVKPLGALLASTNLFSGATLSGDGDVILILDLPAIEQGYRSQVQTSARASAPVFTTRARASTSQRRKVLVADDSLSVRKVAEKYLAAIGYDSVLAVDGLDALEKLRAEDDIAAVLTDLEMPRMHGYELIAELRQSAAFRELPIIVVTSRDAEKHRRRAAELGASGYITKPFTREQLAERLEALITTAASV